MNEENSEYMHANDELIKKVNEKMPEENFLFDLAELYKIFGDSTRIKILYVLFEAEMCVNDIAQVLSMNVSAISHQLKILKDANLVANRREGKTIYYFLSDDHVRTIISKGFEHLIEERTENNEENI